ncbi:MAG: Holliday junction resolvase RuvX [Anaerolineales bacterium]|nr:Holliday junction resolvase RuvX [Anaerolineales bacterium]
MTRILAIDPGDKNIGVALSDPDGIIASPLMIINHISRAIDAARIAEIAAEKQAELIIVGQAFDEDGLPSPQGKKAARLAAAVRDQSNLPVKLWDESFSTQTARLALIAINIPKKKRRGHLDNLAATVILQSYLDSLNR